MRHLQSSANNSLVTLVSGAFRYFKVLFKIRQEELQLSLKGLFFREEIVLLGVVFLLFLLGFEAGKD